jgi:phage terminase large subunit
VTERSVQEIVDHFTDKQREALEAVFAYDFVLYGGARYGGKSRWMRWTNVILLLYWYHSMGLRNVRTAIFCESYPTLKDRQISKIVVEFPSWLGVLKESQEEGFGFYLNEQNGSGAVMLRNLDDPDKYKSAEFAAISVDQLEMNVYETFELLRGSKRWPGIAHTKFLGSANPGGVGHGWIKRLWIDRDFPKEMDVIKEQFKFIQSLPKDNPYLEKSYWDELNSLSPDLRKAWVDGDWNIFEGQAFNQFRKDRHVVQPFEIPVSWPRWRGIDWGFRRPMVCLWVAKDPDTGRQYVYRELHEVELTDRQQAKRVLEWTPPGEAIQITYADPAMWTRKNVEDRVTSTADEYRAEGLIITKGDNDRLSGKRKVDRLLANLPDGLPGIQIFENCINLIRTLPSLPYSKSQVEDVDTSADDDDYDALRYAQTRETSMKPARVRVRKQNPWRTLDYGRR